MDFSFDLSSVYPGPSEVVRLGQDLLPLGHRSTSSLVQQRAAEVLEAMGAASARAQQLRAPITTAARIRCHPEHAVYLMLDRESNGGMGSVVGLLKVRFCLVYF